MKRSVLAAMLVAPLLPAAVRADEVLIHGRLTQEGPDFVVTDDQGHTTRFSEIWKPHKISRALGQDQAFWFRVQRSGKPPHERLRLMESYETKPLLGPERLASQRQEKQTDIEEKIRLVAAQQASFRWTPEKINSSRGVWSRTDNAFTVSMNDKHGATKAKTASPVVVGRLAPAGEGHGAVRPAEVRPQTVTIAFRDAAAAVQAWLEPLPLYAGYHGAATCRWDDSDLRSDLLVSQVGAEQGVFGTCFLNGRDGALCGTRQNQPGRAGIRKILDLGGSIGNHAYTHPAGYTFRSRNRQFWEAIACRAEWEALGDCSIATVAPPYNRYGDDRSIDLWLRAGHYGFINNAGRTVERYGYADLVCDQVLAVYGTHARSEGRTLDAVRGGPGKAWADMHRDRRLWTPNFNQFAAYRFQYEHTGIAKTIDGRVATFTLYRPAVVDLNDAIPLTLTVAGVAADAVLSIDAAGARVERLPQRPSGEPFAGCTFHLGHTPDQRLPERIGFIENQANSANIADVPPDRDFPLLPAVIWYRDGKLHVRIDNRTDRPLHDVTLTYRVPLGWDKDVVRRRGLTVAAGQSCVDALPLALATDQYDLLRGRAWFYVQVDFLHGDVPGRLHLATGYRVLERPDARRPAGHFLAVGPIVQTLENPGAVLDPRIAGPFGDKLLADARAGRIAGWRMCDDGETYSPDVIQTAPILSNAEAYPPQRRGQVDWYLARGVLESDRQQTVYVRTPATHLLLNGRPVRPDAQGREPFFVVSLTAGRNEILFATPLSIRNITALHGVEFVILTKPEALPAYPPRGIRFSAP